MDTGRDRAEVITDAHISLDEARTIRTRRYIAMMGVRLLVLISLAILTMAEVGMMWLWLPAGAIVIVTLPWLAVLLANDRLSDKSIRRMERPVVQQTALSPSTKETIDSELP